MLRFMRRHASRWVLGVLLVIIIVAFVFGFGFNRNNMDRSVAQVGSYKISAVEYWETFKKTENYYRMIYRDKFDEATRSDLKLKETVMSQLVDKYLLLTKAEEMGLRVSDREISENLEQVGMFKKNGKFDRDAYLDFLRKNKINPLQFEKEQQDSMLIGKLIGVIQDNGARIDEGAAHEGYLKEKGQMKLAIAVFDPEDFRNKVAVDEKESIALFEKEKDMYRSENTFQLKYMVINEKSGVRDDQAYMDMLKSKDMSGYGRSKGIEVVDTGILKERDLVTRFGKLNIQDKLKGLAKGEISLPVRDGNVSYIFQLVDRAEGKPYEKADALKIAGAKIARDKAAMFARVKAEDAVKDKGMKFSQETGFIARQSGSVPGVGEIPKEHSGLFALSKGETYGKPVEINGKYYVLACTDVKQPENDQWEKEKETYKRSFAMSARTSFFNAFKEDLRKNVKVKINWESL